MKLLSKLIVLLTITLSLNIFANTVEEADELFDVRGDDVTNAIQAAEIYGSIARSSDDKTTKAELLYKQSRTIYYVGTVTSGDSKKMEIFERSYTVANEAVKLIGDNPEDYEQEELWAKASFYYGAALGKWGEAKGIVASLGKWPTLRATMEAIIDKGFEDIEEYGAARVLGRAYYKIPKVMGGSKKKSLKYLSQSFNETLSDDAEVSIHGLNNLFYADTLKAKKQKSKACEILKTFIEQDPELLLDTRIPETKVEIEMAKAKIKDFNC